MPKVLKLKVQEKLLKLREYLKILREMQKLNEKSFLEDYHHYGLAERYLHLAIEAVLDVGRVLISALNLKRPYDDPDIFGVLAESKIITGELHDRIVGMSRFRNILVHEYGDIDRKIVYKNLQTRLVDLEEFEKQMKRFLLRKQKKGSITESL